METLRLAKPFGRLRVLKRVGKRKALCVCECGQQVEVYLTNLYTNSTQSCGCLGKERRATAQRGTHGMHGTPEYVAWQSMKNRCFNKKSKDYKRYGGRGITVHAAWAAEDGFAQFFAHVGPRPSPHHSLDREDNDKGYVPGNVRWSVRLVQTRNRSNAVLVRFGGKPRYLAELCQERGVPYHRAYNRLQRGLSVAQSLR